MESRHRPRRAPLLWILLPFAGGIALARSWGPLPIAPLATAALVLCLASLFLARRSYPLWSCAIALCALCAGTLRYQAEAPPINPLDRFAPREANLEIEILHSFPRGEWQRDSGIATIRHAPEILQNLVGQRIHFNLTAPTGASEPLPGESYRAKGVLRSTPRNPEPASFDSYLKNRLVSFTFEQGRLLETTAPAPALTYFAQRIKNLLADTLARNALPDSELTGAFRAMMLSERQELTPQQKDLFLRNGTMHLFAISGLHIGVIAACIHYLFTLSRLPSRLRPFLTLGSIALFVVATGNSASAWRALLMIACYFLCQSARRQPSTLNAMVLSALIYLALKPEELFQAGFQMSDRTIASIIMLGLPLARLLNDALPLFARIPAEHLSRPAKAILWVKKRTLDGLAISIAAFVSSSLLGAYYFQLIPTYGVLVNLLTLPLASLAIIAGFISIILSPLLPLIELSALFNNAALLTIAIIQYLLQALGSLPAASIPVAPFSLAQLCLGIAVITALTCLAYDRSASPRALAWQTVPAGATVVWLALIIW